MRSGMGISGWVVGCLAAFQWLTRLPVPVSIPLSLEVCRRSVVFYPFVGLVVGAVLTAAAAALSVLLPPLPAGVLLAALWIGLTGALHLDGLIDTADGLLSHRSRERMLEIMKDSRVGAMGVVVGVLAVLLKAALLVEVLALWRTGLELSSAVALLAVPVWSRWFMVWAIAHWPYAREGEGMGIYFRMVGWREALYATVAALTLSFAVGLLIGQGAGASTLAGLWLFLGALFLLAMAFGFVLASLFSRKLGGLTGDTYGALNELLELALLAVFVAMATAGG